MSRMQLERAHNKYRRAAGKLLRQAIADGRPTTREYRKWCDEHGHTYVEGAEYAGGAAPWPFPMRDPAQCLACRVFLEQDSIDEICTVPARTTGLPEDCHPAEYDQACPHCQSTDGFGEVKRCEECGEHPCICEENDDG